MSPYNVDIESLKESTEIKGEKELLKLKLIAAFLKITSSMETQDILSTTGLHKSDLSRLRSLNTSRFTIDRIIVFLDQLGFSANVDIQPKAS